MAKRSKNIKITAAQRKIVEELAPFLTVDNIAEYLKINIKTFRAIMLRDEELLIAYKRGNAEQIKKVTGQLFRNIENGDKASIFFYLKTRARWREKSAPFDDDFIKEFNALAIDDIAGRQDCLFRNYTENNINEEQFELLSTQLKAAGDYTLLTEIRALENRLTNSESK